MQSDVTSYSNSIDDIKLDTVNSFEISNITGICVRGCTTLRNGIFLITDLIDHKLLLINVKGKRIGEVGIGSTASDVTWIRGGEMAATTQSNEILKVNIETRKIINRVKTRGRCDGIVFHIDIF